MIRVGQLRHSQLHRCRVRQQRAARLAPHGGQVVPVIWLPEHSSLPLWPFAAGGVMAVVVAAALWFSGAIR